MNANKPTLPAQAKAFLDGQSKVDTYEATGGLVTAQFAEHNLTLIPSLTASSVVHDNACGSGTVTKAIMATSPPSGIKIYATDPDQLFLDRFQEDATKHSWPVEISNQKGEKLLFEDNFFTHSLTNIGIIFFSSAGLDGAKEIYRTLRPGGTAVVNCWEHITWLAPIRNVHLAMRPGKPFPAPPLSWADGKHIQDVMVNAGFAKENLKVEKSDAWAKPKDLKKWAEMTWAYLGGVGGWQESDAEKWDEAVELLVKELEKAEGTKVVDGEVWMRAGQWAVVATK